jgi:hypothetical protein
LGDHTQIESHSKSLLELQFDWIFCNLVSTTKNILAWEMLDQERGLVAGEEDERQTS